MNHYINIKKRKKTQSRSSVVYITSVCICIYIKIIMCFFMTRVFKIIKKTLNKNLLI